MINRKKRQVDIVVNRGVEVGSSHSTSSGQAGFEKYRFIHNALPELNFNEIDTSVFFLGKKLSAPLMIAPMTGGFPEALEINRNLAMAAEECGVGIGLGSMRVAIQNQKSKIKDQKQNAKFKNEKTKEHIYVDPGFSLQDKRQDDLMVSYKVREYCKSVPLLADLGAVQLNFGFGIEECKRAVSIMEADGLILHLNAIQEVIQSKNQKSKIKNQNQNAKFKNNYLDGDVNFKGLLEKIGKVCRSVSFPIFVGEVGFGISEEVAKKLIEAGVSGILTGGFGGTNWAKVSGIENSNLLGEVFSDWGIPTAESILQSRIALESRGKGESARQISEGVKIVATGGIRNGIDIAKSLVLGADLAGIAGPFLKPATISKEAVIEKIEEYKLELKTAMMGVGAKDIGELKEKKLQSI